MTLLAEVVRSGFVESTHHGSLVALRPDGTAALELGHPDLAMLPRSSNKPLQATGLLEAGWEPASSAQLALATASHSGESGHLALVLEVLGPLGEQALQTPVALPLDEGVAHALLAAGGRPSRLTMNCSGKHAAMLATCVTRGWSTDDYLTPDHPVQQACRAAVERLAGERVEHVVVDGCGAPQHGLTLRGLARAFSALVTGDGPERQVASAMHAHPWYVGGTGRDTTALMEQIPGLVAKEGAEGVWAAALPDGSAVALKIDDGAVRARTPVLVAALRTLGVQSDLLDELASTPVLGGGRPVGEVRVARVLAQSA